VTQFSEISWKRISGLMTAIHALPFNRELAAGTLERERFLFYVAQDSHYLNAYSRALSFAAARADSSEAMRVFSGAAREAIEVERALHAGFMEEVGATSEALGSAEPSPTCAAYCNFLLATAAIGGYGELTAAILPCFWIYREVGLAIAAKAAPDNPYRRWIDTYADEAFGEATRQVIEITDAAHLRASADEAAAMDRAFDRSSQYEWLFWDSAYRMEVWPVAVENFRSGE